MTVWRDGATGPALHEAERRRACQELFRTYRKAADPKVVAAILRASPAGPDPAYLTHGRVHKSLSQSDMAYALGLSTSNSYARLEAGKNRWSVELLLRFGKLCAISEPAELDHLWKNAKGRPFPRRSDLVGLYVPEDLLDLVLDDTSQQSSP